MSTAVRLSEQAKQKRLHQISRLKEQKKKLGDLRPLKDSSAWEAFREIALAIVKSEQNNAHGHLRLDHSEHSYSEARRSQAVADAIEDLLETVDKTEAAEASYSQRIKQIEDELKEQGDE